MRKQEDATVMVSTSVAESLLSLASLPTPESLSCFFCCSRSSTLDQKSERQGQGLTSDTSLALLQLGVGERVSSKRPASGGLRQTLYRRQVERVNQPLEPTRLHAQILKYVNFTFHTNLKKKKKIQQ